MAAKRNKYVDDYQRAWKEVLRESDHLTFKQLVTRARKEYETNPDFGRQKLWVLFTIKQHANFEILGPQTKNMTKERKYKFYMEDAKKIKRELGLSHAAVRKG